MPSSEPAQPSPAGDETPAEFAKRRMSGDERRQHLIEAALHLFATNGFRGTTTKAIAQAAGVSEGIIFRHFPTKEDLYTAILNHKVREQGIDQSLDALRRIAAAEDDKALVLQLALKTFESYRNDLDFQRLMLRAALEGHDLARVSQRTLGLPLFDLLRDYVVKRQEAGAFRSGDPALLVFGLVALPLYYAIVSRLFGLDVVKQPDGEVAATLAQLVLDGVRPRDDAPDAAPADETDEAQDRTPRRTR
jgi:TetR/AcrR family transcriptional regulator